MFSLFHIEFVDGKENDFRVRSDNDDALALFQALEPGQPVAAEFSHYPKHGGERRVKLDCRDIRLVDVEAE